MSFYNFAVRTPTHVMATGGVELADASSARVEAARRVGDLLKEHAGQFWTDEEWNMDVTDQSGLILYVILVSAMKSAATDNDRVI